VIRWIFDHKVEKCGNRVFGRKRAQKGTKKRRISRKKEKKEKKEKIVIGEWGDQ